MTVWVLITSGSIASNIVILCWAWEVWTDAKHQKRVSEMQRKTLKQWIDNVLDERDEKKKADIISLFAKVIPGLFD